ncbi:unnamed protein product [Arabis nemorensis]|uniref:Neprosin PEP catalytic domain-containing protein n=1 Tax=Arabis nemorensis TaxID=586526 RepID=A0A565ASI4_9BRAS|nr:unnamed protein product [Arabis nemorensis]
MIQETEKKIIWQVWNQNGTRCPSHTIPIRRNHVGAKPGKKTHLIGVRQRFNREAIPYPAEVGHEATLGIWDPIVVPGIGEFSFSQMWLVAGHYNESDLNTVEAGWEVFPEHYHDNQPRLFIYWTRDTYQYTGCRNFECEGFVQVSSKFAIGAAFAPVSSYDGSQTDITMTIWKDTDHGNWWLGIGQSFVGYWPAKLFTHLADGPATVVQWGGEVVNTRSYGQHTTTQMGSGHFAQEGFGKATFVRNIGVVDQLYHLHQVQDIRLQAMNSSCYNAVKLHNEEWGTHFYYGGPGFNAFCP